MTFYDAGIDVGQYDVGRKDNHPRTVRLRDGAAHPVTPGPARTSTRSAVATHQKRHSKNIKMCMAPNPTEEGKFIFVLILSLHPKIVSCCITPP